MTGASQSTPAADLASTNATLHEAAHSIKESMLPVSNQTRATAAPAVGSRSGKRTNLPASNSRVDGAIVDALAAVSVNDSDSAPEPMVCPTLGVPNDYIPDGEPPRSGNPEAHVVRSPRSAEKPQHERVLILAANSGGSCQLQLGDYYNFLSLLDKLQYGNVHGYDVLLGMGDVDDDLRKVWNKVAWMLKVRKFSHQLRSACRSSQSASNSGVIYIFMHLLQG